MSPKHGPRRAKVAFSVAAADQLAKLTVMETLALDRAIVAISTDPALGTPIPDSVLRDYQDDDDSIRILFYLSALRTVIVVAYLEIG
ncbi:hypothetical protein [Streptomyces sp. H39-S7]|uniref:hypothetical protein n=1 Tax=Streptomyces sp. H39-S7 TaxID=3004357 RepID=UPI0022B021C5|nr:hypothetical protein [Streptomyces sp. H39-S7]MCZ4124969.1 hypothetical protein [Streptomyces sp. H39-S7]